MDWRPMVAGEFDGRVALVTGGARGMGRAIIELLASRGAQVAVNDLDPEATAAAAHAIGNDSLAVAGDVADPNRVRAIVDQVADHYGRLDVLVNNAGIAYHRSIYEITDEEWSRVFAVNVQAVFTFIQSASKPMAANGYGRVVNFSSTAGKNVSTVAGAHYTASKAAVLGITRASALELAVHGITVNAVCPGMIDTQMIKDAWPQERIDAYIPSIPLQRMGQPSEVAELVAFLASERAGYITGAAVDITGGELMV